ncbi:hypothetical protein [Emticicia agri]|uniref:Peptidase S74 domain-containing protein n=1 Tax=Emticicia agri TaxID=2492393 RepID=A0A4Q5LWZ9_9BACT|nr:hypothetical protein [Emticicia agri]RYU94356.1 hypothetical protein EWM59_17075 [Emticicia agri]
MKTNFTKSLYVAAIFSASTLGAFAQKERANVGIGTTQPHESAVLDIKSSNQGLLIPRMSLQQRNAIQNPANGLMVYQTDLLSGFYFFDGKDWKPLTSATENYSVAADPNDWTKAGNLGTNPLNDFLGTIDNQPLVMRVANIQGGYIGVAATSKTFLGMHAGKTGTGIQNSGFGFQSLSSLTTGASNTGVGSGSLMSTTSGNSNTAVGRNALGLNQGGSSNVAIGQGSQYNNISGAGNLSLGTNSLYEGTAANGNIGLGTQSLFKTQGTNNIALGTNAGYSNVSGTLNLFLGYNAGYNETGSNKLYIANSTTANPLIKGEFDNKNLKINLGATKSTTVGFLAVGNFDAAFAMPTGNPYRLIVQDGIITEKVKVALKGTADWADYVFEPSYQLMPLEKVESFVKENKHLPNVPSAEDMSKNGLDVSQTSAKLMEKIEELTLYMIEMNKEIKALKAENANLKKVVEQK